MNAPARRLSPLFVSLLCASLLTAGCNNNPQQTADVKPEPVVDPQPSVSTEQPPATQSLTHSTIPAAPQDVWARIRNGFKLNHEAHKRVDEQLAFYQRYPRTLTLVSKQAEPYLHLIVEEVEKRGMPMELALLPVVESGFRPFAYSHGRAAGLWQFIPSTGRHFGLRQDWWYDGRRDVIASTHAALDYLQRLGKQFDGDWYQAIAAYNAGEANIFRAIRRNKKAGKPTDFWNLKVPKETSKYVPRLLAISRLVADPEKYGISLNEIPNQQVVRQVNANGQIDLAVASQLAGVEMDELYALNPAYNRWATPPKGPHTFLLRVDAANRFEQSLATLDDNQRMRWDHHLVKKGESLGRIAHKYKTSVSQIRQANHIRGNTIRIGQDLLVPRASYKGKAYVLSADQRLQKAQNSGKGRKQRYTVRSGDNLWTIARKHGVSHRRLAKWNGMAPGDPLSVGRKLVIYNGKRSLASRSTTSPLPRSMRNQRITYRVRKGDSLYKIAKRFSVSIPQIRNWNRLKKTGYLRPGQKLMLHVDVTRQS